jgi:hypothetical protein
VHSQFGFCGWLLVVVPDPPAPELEVVDGDDVELVFLWPPVPVPPLLPEQAAAPKTAAAIEPKTKVREAWRMRGLHGWGTSGKEVLAGRG